MMQWLSNVAVPPLVDALVAARGTGGAKGQAYFRALNTFQPHSLASSGNIRNLTFTTDLVGRGTEILNYFNRIANEGLVDPGIVRALTSEEARSAVCQTAQALELLRVELPAYYDLIFELVAELLFARKDRVGGASFGSMLGMVWVSPRMAWSPNDFAEVLIHETTHQALFLREAVIGLYCVPRSELSSTDLLVTSSIRRTERPYDASLHAAVVAASLIDFHHTLGRTAVAEELRRPLLESAAQLEAKSYVLSKSGREVLADVLHVANMHLVAA